MTNRYLFMIGTTMTGGADPITNLEELTTPITPPKSTFSQYASVVELADGSKRGVGAPVATWHWGFLSREMRDQLRHFCTEVSSVVYIRTYTKDNAGAPKYFLCQMSWPVTGEETDATKAIDFTVEFKQMEQQADP